MTSRALLSLLLALPVGVMASACSSEPEKPATPVVQDPCPDIGMDKMANDWLKIRGQKGDHKNRFRVVGEPGAYEAWLVPGMFQHVRLKGTSREKDILFEQVLTAEQETQWKAGTTGRIRMTVEPNKKQCELKVVILESWFQDGQETEKRRESMNEKFIPFPAENKVEFTYRPADGPLFIGDSAKDRSKADAEIKKYGQPEPTHEFGEKIPLGVFTKVADDGDPSCTYDMDLFFDDQPVEGKKNVPAQEPKGDWRHWYVPEWYAPYSGPHHFEIYRYRTCGGKRELIGVNALEAVLS